MASELLKTFRKIDEGRKLQIERARIFGYTVKDDATFAELAGTMTPHGSYVTRPTALPDWERPAEWADGYSMLRDEVGRDGLFPGMFVMVANSSTTPIIQNNNSGGYTGSGATACLTSDGTWYNDLSSQITHTWDQTKDTVIESGEFAGRYRWVLYYYDPNVSITSSYAGDISAMNPVEIIVGNIRNLNNAKTSFKLLATRSTPYNNLINFEVLPESNVRGIYNGGVTGTSTLTNMVNLRHLDLGPITSISAPNANSSTTGVGPINFKKLKHLDLSNITSITMSGHTSLNYYGVRIDIGVNLSTFKCNANQLFSVSTSLQNFEEFKIPNGTLRFLPADNNVGSYIVPETEAYSIKAFQHGYPSNWTTSHNKPVSLAQSGTTATTKYSYICCGHPTITSVDLRESNLGTGVITVGNNCPALKEIKIPTGAQTQFNIAYPDLLHSNLIEILENLYDYSGSTTTPTITLGVNYSKLSEDEIKIATDKGWTVVE